MAKARATASGTMTFGLVGIPFKVYTAASSEQTSFRQLHKACGGTLKQQMFCEKDNCVVPREDIVKGHEHARDQFVQFTPEELEKLDASQDNELQLSEFVPAATIDPIYFEKSHFLGPDKGGERAYALLAQSLRNTGLVGVGKHYARGRDSLAIVRPYADGLILHTAYYASELRAFDDVDMGGKMEPLSDKEIRLAEQLVRANKQKTFDASGFTDEFRARIEEAIAAKVAGKEIKVLPDTPKAQVIDLRKALEMSVQAKGALRKGRSTAPPARQAG